MEALHRTFSFTKSKLESKNSEKTLNEDVIFSGKVVSVSEFQNHSTLKRLFTPKKNECGIKTRKDTVTLEIHSNAVKEVMDGKVVASIDISNLQFGLIPAKQGKRFQFTIQGRSDDRITKRQYEVQSAQELALWYSQFHPQPQPTGQTELFWKEFSGLVEMVKQSVVEQLEEMEKSDRVLKELLQECELLAVE